MKFLDQYEINIYAVLVVLFLVFSIGYTVLIIRQQQIISQMASAKETKSNFGPTILSDQITLTGQIDPSCSNKVFSLDSRQANTADLRTLHASVPSVQGEITLEVDRRTNNVNADTEFILRGQGYLSKKKSLGKNNELDFGELVAGDANSDGKINQKDLDALNVKIKAKQVDTKFDFNCDNQLDEADREIVTAALGKVSD